MKVHNMVTISFTEDEVIEGLKCLLSCDMNDLVAGTPEHTRREKIVSHLEKTTSRIEYDEGKYQLMMDGYVTEEEF